MTIIESLRELPAGERSARLNKLTSQQLLALRYDWPSWARPSQRAPPGDWLTWLILAGRGFGKTRTGCQWVLERIRDGAKRIAIVGRTAGDVRDVLIEGESGIMRCSPPWDRPKYEPSKRRITWPSGAVATTYSAAEPDLLRGPQHDTALCDELASWPYWEAWDNLMFGLRIGKDPRVCAATTPRPLRRLRDLIADSLTHTTRGSTYDNLNNLAPAFKHTVVAKYEGTTLGRQELNAELLDEAQGALWQRAGIDAGKVPEPPHLSRVVVAIDPAVTAKEGSDETGIVVAGIAPNDHIYVLGDSSGILAPLAWAKRAVTCYTEHKADRVVAEANNGGDLVRANLQNVAPDLPVTLVHASRGKQARAEPIAALYEQQKVHHVGTFPDMEDQMCVSPGSIVQTRKGPCVIEALKEGDSVATRDGWRRVTWAGRTGSAEILRIELRCGRALLVTGRHPIASADGLWICAEGLSAGDKVLTCQCRLCANSSNSTEFDTLKCAEDISGRAETDPEKASCCIEHDGPKPTAPSPMVPISIMSMETQPTTSCPICKPSLHPSTRSSTLEDGRRTGLSSEASDEKRIGPTSSRIALRAKPAVSASNRKLCESHSARVVVSEATVVNVTSMGMHDVWNASVEGNHELLVNGVLTHNCNYVPGTKDGSPDRMDALVWACTELTRNKGTVAAPSASTGGSSRWRI